MSTKLRNLIIKKSCFAALGIVLITGISVGLAIGNDIAFNQYATNITAFLCDNGQSNSSSSTQTMNSGNELAEQIIKEGLVMVKNDNDCLPLSKSITKVNCFGYQTIDWRYCNSGSGRVSVSNQTLVNVADAIEMYGFEYNKDITDFYRSWASPRGYLSTLNVTGSTFYKLFEPKIDEYSALLTQAEAYSDTAIVTISRWAGEHQDAPHVQYKNKYDTDNTRGYMTISTEEEELLKYVGKTYENVVVIINSTNTMQLDFVDSIPGIDACLIVGATGIKGAKGIPHVLWGDTSPSGRVVDTYPRDLKYNVTYYTVGVNTTNSDTYTPSYDNAPSEAICTTQNSTGGSIQRVPYVDYIEGIYVGYRWFETANAEGYWDKAPYNGYENVVQYPFGFGLSYTSFKWEVVSSTAITASRIKENQDITYEVKVTNTGNATGRDVVEIYLTAPYTKGGIEKSSVKLIGFAKTPELSPKTSVTLKITVHTYDFTSYDCYDKNGNGFKGYELEQGQYQVKFMENCHTLKEDMEGQNTFIYEVEETIKCHKDQATEKEIKNLFTGTDAVDGISIDGSNVNQDVQYISRENFPALLTSKPAHRKWNASLEVTRGHANAKKYNAYSAQMATAWDNATGKDAFGRDIPTTKPVWGKNNNVEIISNNKLTDVGNKIAANYYADEWNEVLEKVTIQEAIQITNSGSAYLRPGVPSVGLGTGANTDYADCEAAQQIDGFNDANKSSTGFPNPTTLAQSWDTSLALTFGRSIGAELNAYGKNAVYSPATNIHRSPYSGRNSEYYSEDPILSGLIVSQVTKGYTINGKNAFIKHFAANDCEFARVGLYTWLSEQALREIHLRPFEEAVKRGKATALMTSFNRIGATWAGGNEALIQGVLRNEWGFHGMIISDYVENTGYMDGAQAFRAGGNYMLSGNAVRGSVSSLPSTSSPARTQWALKEVAKQVIWATINPIYENATYNESADASEFIISLPGKAAYEWWKPALVAIEIMLCALVAYGAFWCFWPSKKLIEEVKAYNASKHTKNKEEK